MGIKNLLLSLLFLSCSMATMAQDEVIGVVTDQTDEPLIGATVKIKGTGEGVVTDFDGKYKILAKKGQVLQFTYIGMKEKLVRVADNRVINVKLQDEAIALNEVVAIGYGTMKRSDLTGSVASVNSDAIDQMKANTIDEVLQGHLAGVQMTQNSGTPGGGSSVQIRGVSSINSTNEPIYIIDGMTISGETGSNTDNVLSSINPADIESMEVLKDASATAIYGAQGANGVIIITTKKGKAGKAKITAEARYAVQMLSNQLEMADLREYAYHNNLAQEAYGGSLSAWFADPLSLGKGTNWQKAIFTNAATQNYNLGISGGKDKTTWRVSAGLLDQDGVATGSKFNRITADAGVDTQATDWLKIGAKTNFSNSKQTITIVDWNIINAAVKQKPSVPVRNLDGSFAAPEYDDATAGSNDPLANPLAVAELYDKYKTKLGFRSSFYADFKVCKWLGYKTEVSVNYTGNTTHSFVPQYYFNDFCQNANATRDESMQNELYWSWRNIVNMKFKFGKATKSKTDVHTVALMLGHEMNSRSQKYLYAKRIGGSEDILSDISAGDAMQATNEGYTTDKRFLSFFCRANYNYSDRYLATLTLRADGSSNFADGHKWGYFPSAALAWRASREDFLKEVNWLSNLKLRFGYGLVGNSNVSAFAYTAILKNMPTIWGTGYMLNRMPNENLTWEKTHSMNFGIDFSAFNNRIEVVFDAYHKRTNDLLMVLSLPGIAGTTGASAVSTQAPWSNVGSLTNKGVELTLNSVNINKNGFRWRTSLTLAHNINKVERLNTATASINRTYQYGGNTYVVTRTAEGHSIGEFWGYKCIGRINSADDLYDSNGNLKVALPEGIGVDRRNGVWVGDLLFEDINNDGVINEKDQTYIGSPHPKLTGGLGNTFSWKGFDLNVFFNFSLGGKIMNWLALSIDNPNERQYNITKQAAVNFAHLALYDNQGSEDDIYNVYVAGGNPDLYRINPVDPNNNNRISTRLIEDGSYLRLQTLSLSYTLPTDLTERFQIKKARLYFTASNLLTITRYSGYDPAVGMGKDQYSSTGQSALLNGFDNGRYPTPRTFTFGLNIEL